MKPAVKAELDRLTESAPGGRLMPAAVIKAARNKNSALHAEYEWNKDKAHALYLKRRTQELMADYMVVIMRGDIGVKTRHFVSLTTDRASGGGYRVISEVLTDEVMTRQLLADALTELASFQAKYRRLSELAGVFSAIESVLEKHQRKAKAAGKRRPPPESRAAA